MTTIHDITEDFTIEDGPSREQLFDTLRLFNEKRDVTFTLRRKVDTEASMTMGGHKYEVPAYILGISVEDGSGHSWCLRVQFVDNRRNGSDHQFPDPVDVYYHDDRRKGAIVDSRPLSKRVTVDRNGQIWAGGRNIGEVPKQAFA